MRVESYHWVALSSWIFKILSVLVQIVSIPILTGYLSINQFAAYVIVISLVPWFQLADFGFGNAVQNKISEKIAKNEDIKSLISTFMLVAGLIFLIGILLSWKIGSAIDQFIIFEGNIKLQDNIIGTYVLCSMMLFGMAIATAFQKILYSLNKGIIANILMSLCVVSSFGLLVLFKISFISTENKLLWVFISFAGPMFLYGSVGLVFYGAKEIFKISLKKHSENIKKLWSLSSKFWIISIFSTATLNIDYLIMSKTLNSIEIAQYNIIYRIFFVLFSIYVGLSTAVWPKFTQLYAFNRVDEINKIIKRMLSVAIGFVILFTLIIFEYYYEIMKILAPKVNIPFNKYIILSFAVYILVRVWTETYSVALQSTNKLNIFIYMIPVQALLSALLQWWLSVEYGVIGIIMGLILSFILTAAWILPKTFNRYFVKKGILNAN